MTKCGFDVTRLRSSLSQSQFRVPAAQIDRHFGARDASLLDEIKGFAGIARAELAGIANKHKPARANQVGQRDQTLLVAVREHRGLIKKPEERRLGKECRRECTSERSACYLQKK